MNPLVAVAVQFLPQLLRYIGGPTGGKVADAVGAAVGAIVKTQDPVEAKQKLDADPRLLADLQVKLAEIAAKADADQRQSELDKLKEVFANQQANRQSDLDEIKTRLGETQSARATVAAAPGGGTMAIGSLGVSLVVSVAFVAILFFIMYDPSRLNDMQADKAAFQMVNITLGALTAAFVTVVSFWLGSSQGSRNKDAASFQQAQVSQATITEQASQQAKVAEKSMELTSERAAPKLVSPVAAGAPVAVVTPLRKPGIGRFDQCFDVILRKEGGYVNDPHDPGGATNMGITIGTLKAWRNRDSGTQGGQGPVEVTPDDVKALTEDEAKEIYFVNYWNALRCQEMPAGLDLTVFDFGVNAGVGRAARVLQKCVFVETDGQVGDITLGAVHNFPPIDLIHRFDEARMDFYRGLSSFDRYGPGWTNRVRSVETSALAMAQAA